MYWLRAAALYLSITALIVASIWMFWGDSLRRQWNTLHTQAGKSSGKKTAATRSAGPHRETPAKLGLPAGDAAVMWKDTQSGFVKVLELLANEQRALRAGLDENYNARYRVLVQRKAPVKLPAAAEKPAAKNN